MHFDPYESKTNRRRRILSDVLIVLVILAFLWGIYHVLFETRNRVQKYSFANVTATAGRVEDNGSFAKLVDYGAIMEEETKLDGSFREEYPLPAAMLAMEPPYEYDTPYFRYDGRHLILAQTVLSETADERLLEIVVADASDEQNDDGLTVMLSDFRACAVAYNAKTDRISYRSYDSGRFHLDLKGLTVSPDANPAGCEITVKVKGSGSTLQPEKWLYDEIDASSVPVASRQDRSYNFIVESKKPGDQRLTLNVSDGMLTQYASVTFRFAYAATDEIRVSFTANKEKK